MGENPHAGHRQRLRLRFLNYGLEHFAPHNMLELLLFYAIPQRDTNELAHRLIDRFGSLAGVFDAPAGELRKVKGMGEGAVALIKLIPALGKAYADDKNAIGTRITNTKESVQFLLPKFVCETAELVLLLCMDNKCKVLGCPVVCRGDVNSANFSARSVVEEALRLGATRVILAHNHPRGLALPSAEDLDTTDRLRDILRPVGIELVDHLVVANGDCVSLAESGHFYRK